MNINIEDVGYFRIRHESKDKSRKYTGGSYEFVEHYARDNKFERFVISYSTSAEFDFCELMGVFQECRNCREFDPEEKLCYQKSFTIDEEDVKEKLEEADFIETF